MSCASATSSATSSTATASSSTSPSAGALPSPGSIGRPRSSRTRTIRSSRRSQRAVGARCSSASTTLARARTGLQHASDSKYCIRCGHPYRYDAAYVGHLGAYRCEACGHARPPLDVVAREIEPDGLDGVSFELHAPDGSLRVRLAVPGLYNVYNALAAASLALSLGVALDDVVAGLERFQAAFGRFERFSVGDRGFLLLLVKNPAGANEALRTLEEGGVPPALVVALNDRIADGRDVSWIWDVDFEPVLERAERIVVSGERAAELALRFTYAGFPRERLELVPGLEAALDRGLELTPPGGELAVLPTYTAMLELRAIATERGLTRPYWERDGR